MADELKDQARELGRHVVAAGKQYAIFIVDEDGCFAISEHSPLHADIDQFTAAFSRFMDRAAEQVINRALSSSDEAEEPELEGAGLNIVDPEAEADEMMEKQLDWEETDGR